MSFARYRVYLFALSFSLLLSFWCAYSETVINPDGICYILSAQSFTDTPLKGVMNLCMQSGWPFYSYLIYVTAKISSFSYYISAYLLNGLLSLVSVASFIAIVRQLGGRGRTLWFAAFSILLLHDFNGLRQSIIRDHGYWACYLASIFVLLRYVERPKFASALLWNLLAIGATLFRREGVVFLALAPFYTWFERELPFKQRALNFLQLNVLNMLCVLAGGAYLAVHSTLIPILWEKLEALYQFNIFFAHQRLQEMQYVFKHDALRMASPTDINIVISLLYVFWYILLVAGCFTWIFTILALYGLYKYRPNRVTTTYLLINVFITMIFLLQNQFLSKRYVMALDLTLMLYAPFALNYLYERARNKRTKVLFAAAVCGVLFYSVGGVFEAGYSKNYVHQAGDWVAANLPANANIYSNSYQLMYYSKHYGRDIFAKQHEYQDLNLITADKWKKYDYLMIRINKNDDLNLKNIVNAINITPINKFQNKRGDYVAIYQVKGDKS